MFESSNGHYSHKFSFYDNVIDQVKSNGESKQEKAKEEHAGGVEDKTGRQRTGLSLKQQSESVAQKKAAQKVNPADELEKEFKKSGLTRVEFNF